MRLLQNDIYHRSRLCRAPNSEKVKMALSLELSGILLRIKVRLPVLLCAVKTVEDDFRFCWAISPNVGQTHKENLNLV